jgi:hypothetical protein
MLDEDKNMYKGEIEKYRKMLTNSHLGLSANSSQSGHNTILKHSLNKFSLSKDSNNKNIHVNNDMIE